MKKGIRFLIVDVAIILFIFISVCIYRKSAIISKADAKDIILKNMGVDSKAVKFESVNFDIIENLYDIELYYNNSEFEFKVTATDGSIIYTNYEFDNLKGGQNSGTSLNLNKQQAKSIALATYEINENDITQMSIGSLTNNGVVVYNVSFNYDDYNYYLEIDSSNGRVIKQNKSLSK